jgi:hypothetical protein
MRAAALTLLCFVAFGYAMNAQRFSLLPQVGFENSKTTISYNDLRSFSPLGVKFSPQASLRLNYSSKQGHGFFLGIASSRSIVSFSFADPETGMTDFTATSANMQFRFEGGYQFNSKPLFFNKTQKGNGKQRNGCATSARSSCQKSYSSHNCCGSNKRTKEPALAKNKGSWMRIQPSVGLGYIPSVKTDVITKTQSGLTSYEYRAGNWNTALMAGTGFEFGKNNTRLMTVSINYFKGIGNLNTQVVSTQSTVKTATAYLQSDVSGWNLKVGIPFSLGAGKPGMNKRTHKNSQQHRSGCGQYRIMYRCGGH